VKIGIMILIFYLAYFVNSQFGATNDVDSDDMIMQMRKFLDVYAERLKKNQNRKEAYKLLLPSGRGGGHESKVKFSENFDLKSLKEEIESFLETLNKIREKQLKSMREEKQNVEEKNIDLSTKFKILSNRMNIFKNDFSKIKTDYNNKNHDKIYLISESKNLETKNTNNMDEISQKSKSLYQKLRKFDKEVNKFNVTDSVLENDLENVDKLTKLQLQSYKIENDMDSLNSRIISDQKFNFYLENLNNLINKNLNITNAKNKKLQDSIINKQVKLENLKKDIKFKYETYESLNKTFARLEGVHNEYTDVLKNMEETLNSLKSKKRIILDNIEEKKKQNNIKGKTIKTVLGGYQSRLQKADLTKIKYDKDRDEISQIKNRIKQLIEKENLIFRKQKIK